MRNEKYAIWPLVMAESPKLLHSSAMDLWTRLWGKYHVPQNVFLVSSKMCIVLRTWFVLPCPSLPQQRAHHFCIFCRKNYRAPLSAGARGHMFLCSHSRAATGFMLIFSYKPILCLLRRFPLLRIGRATALFIVAFSAASLKVETFHTYIYIHTQTFNWNLATKGWIKQEFNAGFKTKI